MTISYPTINGNRFSFASIELDVRGRIFKGFSDITYSQDLEPGEVRGTGPQLLGRTRGDLKAEGSLGIYIEEDAELIAAIGHGFLEAVFPIVCTFAEEGMTPITDTIVGARFKNGARSFQKGTDGLTIKRDFTALYILENGKAPINNLMR